MLLYHPPLRLLEDDAANEAQHLKKRKLFFRLFDMHELALYLHVWFCFVHDFLENALVALPVHLVMEAEVVKLVALLPSRPKVIHNAHDVGWKQASSVSGFVFIL